VRRSALTGSDSTPTRYADRDRDAAVARQLTRYFRGGRRPATAAIPAVPIASLTDSMGRTRMLRELGTETELMVGGETVPAAIP